MSLKNPCTPLRTWNAKVTLDPYALKCCFRENLFSCK